MGEEYIQWDFGDMLLGKSETPPHPKKTRTGSVHKTSEPIKIDASLESDRKVYTVEELTGEIKFLLEEQFGEVWVSGEVSGLRVQSSGHRYFTLKDTGAQIQCVLFKGTTGVKRSLVEDGKKLILRGELSVYEPRGQYQLIVRELEEAGQGSLAIAFERLKKKLEAEGLFDEERKRPVSAYPRRVGIVTSPTGAALQDILKVLRTPSGRLEVDVILAPSKVQGEGAAEDIVAAIELLNRYHQIQQKKGLPGLDVILVTRGGGSIEDLWCFNEEIVARAIAASALPVISAVGHEIDFCISDFVADVRCATPTAAARFLIQNLEDVRDELDESLRRIQLWMDRTLDSCRERIETVKKHLSLLSPKRRLEDFWLRLDDISQSMDKVMKRKLAEDFDKFQDIRLRFKNIRLSGKTEQPRRELQMLRLRLEDQWNHAFRDKCAELELLRQSLNLLDPKASLKRGYSITVDVKSGKIIRGVKEVSQGTRIRTMLQNGQVESVVDNL